MRIELTEKSRRELNSIKAESFSAADAAAYLQGELCLRSFFEMLSRFYPGVDLKNKLLTAFADSADSAATASLNKKINNWKHNKNIPDNREDVFIIAFALELAEEQADYLLGLCFGYGIHYRNQKEIVYAYCLRQKYSYRNAREMLLALETDTAADHNSQADTCFIKNDFNRVHSDADFRLFYLQHKDEFGEYHNCAYRQFITWYTEIIHPGQDIAVILKVDEPKLSVEEAVNRYFRLSMYRGRNCSQLTALQKLLKRNWPNETALINMYKRKENVSRKIILLLYIITGNISSVEHSEYDQYDEDHLDADELFEEHWYRINLILKECGMPLLDPRNAFDWLVLYSLRITDEDEEMCSRMQKVIECLFGEVNETETS